MGPTFRTPILELMPNVISKIKQNSSDMNEIILAPCDAGYVQSCTGFKCSDMYYLGSVAGPVIQVILGGRNLRMVWSTGDFGSGYSYDISVRTGLSDHTKQTKFQSQRPSDVETPGE
jgi:hypothetical protein